MSATVELDSPEVAELLANLDDPMWRICSGKLYKIIVKGSDDDDAGLVIPFIPNRAQRRLMAKLHHRNLILKARQLGFTTLVCILWLDTALFAKSPIRCGIVAQDKEAAEVIFRDKVKFAYRNLPPLLLDMFPLARDSANELMFAHNGASIRVATSMRSGTIHRLHISEHGKICAKYPDKAKEVKTGSLPAVPTSGITIIESTAEGQDGDFYDMTQRAKALAEKRAPLGPKDYRFHFFPWWEAPEYELDPASVHFTEADNKYFFELEAKIKRKISPAKRAWYVATRDADFSGEAPLMWQEYPSTPEEAFQVSTEGCYYAAQLALARKQDRILPSLPVEAAPVNTFWDIGRGDMTAIWLHQRIGPHNRFLRYYEESGEDLDHYAEYLQKTGFTFGKHYLPHEAAYRRIGQSKDTNRTIEEMLQALLPGHSFVIVPRITSINTGIQATRNAFASCYFDETGCKQGLARLGNYRKVWDQTRGCWKDDPLHNADSHGADAFRQFGQEADNGNTFPGAGLVAPGGGSGCRRRNRSSGMAV